MSRAGAAPRRRAAHRDERKEISAKYGWNRMALLKVELA